MDHLLAKQIGVIKTYVEEADQPDKTVSWHEVLDALEDIVAIEQPRTLTANEFNKLQVYRQRLIAILERDMMIEKFEGSTDYLLRAAIEALGLQELFYDAYWEHDNHG